MEINKNNSNLRKIASILKARRRELKLKLDKVAEETKIRKKYLQDLESGEIKNIVFDVYYLGYLKNYCKILGLNYHELSQKLEFEERKTIKTLKSKDIMSLEDFLPNHIVLWASFFVFISLLVYFNL